ncbi:GAP family protein [Arthrobacter sp. JSM 101049]|uniref:GAP family protein n=1 Tax=Arthrobacter sp. JSM 101049 TaxID=929097 RepID=UPI003563693D
MTTDNLLKLLVLALIDSTSIGTLVIPVWLLLRRDAARIVGKVGVYLAVIGVFYFLVGVLMLTSAHGVLDAWGEGARTFADSRPAHWLALAAGATLLWFGLRDLVPGRSAGGSYGGAMARASGALPASVPRSGPGAAGHDGGAPVAGAGTTGGGREPDAPSVARPARAPGRTPGGTPAAAARAQATEQRWGARIGRALTTPWGLVALALTAGLLELPTMLPYVAAIGVLTVAGPGSAASIAWLAAYCLVMLLPAALLLVARVLLAGTIEGPLRRLGAWLGKASAEAVLWIMGIGGFLLVRYALQGL